MSILRDSLDVIANPGNLDESVREVFGIMLDISCQSEPEDESCGGKDTETVTAVVGFGGILSGACVFRCNAYGARQMAARMTGMDFEAVDDVVKDGIGEICNMLAGTWKGKVASLAANCGLSVPAVITGKDYQLHVQAPEFRVHRRYSFADVQFEITIVCDGLQ